MGVRLRGLIWPVCLALFAVGCSDGSDNRTQSVQFSEQTRYSAANGCFAISADGGDSFLAAGSSGDSYEWVEDVQQAARFLFRPSDLGKYLLYDQDRGYLVADGEALQRRLQLMADTQDVNGDIVITDRLQSEGEWQLHSKEQGGLALEHLQSGAWLAADGLSRDESAPLSLVQLTDCADFPELTLDASGEVAKTEFDDGSVFGFVETHSHLFTNYAFGGGGVFHGAPFHPLGVEHALPNCELSHGVDGRRDIMGFGFSGRGGSFEDLLPAIINGELPEKNHDTEGYPEFTTWPDAPQSPTHQMQYYKWLERAYLSGLRLLVQHATTNQVLCQLAVGIGAQPKRFDCNDMVAVDRIIEATYAMERYIDALAGGPGQGWFRIVLSPEEAREEISAGKLAVVLGIETSDLFDCYLVPFGDFQACSQDDVVARLDEYYEKGVRVLFPVHKFDNAFSAGDGDRRIIDIGNFSHTGHYSNFVECSQELLSFPGGFDDGGVNYADLNQPRDVYDSPPPVDMSGYEQSPLGALLPFADLLASGPLEGEYCQNHGLTDLGEFLLLEMMKRGMIIEVDHFPRKSYKRAYEILQQYDYPALGTHGRNNNGLLYALGGMSKSNLGRCRSVDAQATMDDGFQARIQLMRDKGAFPAEGFGFDLNGFAGAPGPRFGERSRCSDPQDDEGITYPFTSYGGDITFEAPVVGSRLLDFNTEGMVHLGLVAELIEDVRRDGVSDEELKPLFQSAEGYIRVWEKSRLRAGAFVAP